MDRPDSLPLGRFTVGRIGYGAIQLPGPGAFGPSRDRGEALAVLRRAVELGVNHIDTAQFYGPDVSNELIRAALHPYPEDLVLVSKVGARRDAHRVVPGAPVRTTDRRVAEAGRQGTGGGPSGEQAGDQDQWRKPGHAATAVRYVH